jgi:hypothetical protein
MHARDAIPSDGRISQPSEDLAGPANILRSAAYNGSYSLTFSGNYIQVRSGSSHYFMSFY